MIFLQIKKHWNSCFFFAVWLFAGFCLGPLSAAAWWKPYSGNPIEVRGESAGTLRIGRDALPDWGWKTQQGISFLMLPGDQLYAHKPAKPERSEFTLEFSFNQPLKRFRFTTPACHGVTLEGGDIIFEYRIGAQGEFKELSRLTARTPGYVKDGNMEPRVGKWIEFPESAQAKELSLRFVLEGCAREVRFCGGNENGALLDYEIYRSLPSQLEPDATRSGAIYYHDAPPRLTLRIPVAGVSVFDTGRNREAGICRLSQTRPGETVATLPTLRPGGYELRVWDKSGERKELNHRFALVHRPRELSPEALNASPFGMVNINLDGRAYHHGRKAPSIDAPLVGEKLGIHQIRYVDWTWCILAPTPDGYRWQDPKWQADFDAEMEHLRSHKLVPRNSLSWTPEWAVDLKRVTPGTWSGHYPPKDEFLPRYREFCRETARRTSGVKEFEIRNEPNNEPSGQWKGTFEEFVNLCRISAEEVHSVAPEAKMILGTTADADLGYIERLFRAGLSPFYQIVDIHPYPHTRLGPEQFLLPQIRGLQKLIRQYGGKQEIIFSEIGWPTQQFDSSSYERVTEFDQACFDSRLLLIALAADVKRVYFYTVTDLGPNPAEPEENFGIIRNDSSPKPAAVALSVTNRHLEGAKFLGQLPTPDSVFAFAWKNSLHPDATLLAIWADTQMLPHGAAWLELPGTPVAVEDLWGGVPEDSRYEKLQRGVRVLPKGDPIFVYLKNFPLGKLKPLPQRLRPEAVPRRAMVPKVKDIASLPPFGHTTHASRAVESLGYAGVNEAAAWKVADPGTTMKQQSEFSIGWNDTEFLLNVKVRSDRPFANGNTGWWAWAGDSVRLFLSPDATTPWLSRYHYQIALAPETQGHNPPGAFVISYGNPVPAGEAIPDSSVEAHNLKDGWVLTARIPWAVFETVPHRGDIWRFELLTPNGAWNSPGNDKWHNAGNWGVLEFTE